LHTFSLQNVVNAWYDYYVCVNVFFGDTGMPHDPQANKTPNAFQEHGAKWTSRRAKGKHNLISFPTFLKEPSRGVLGKAARASKCP